MNVQAKSKIFSLILAVFLLDRLTKYWIVNGLNLPHEGSLPVLPFFDLTMVWNRGISLGLFQADSDTGRYVLIGLTSLVTIVLFIWLLKESKPIVQIGLASVIGGSLGNIWDRFEYGAVADFLHFYAFNYSFYVFNIADAAISIGVAFLLWDALLSPQKETR